MTLQIGMIGTGWFSRKHAEILEKQEGVSLRAVCGTSKEKAEKLAGDFAGAAGYDSLTQMLAEETLDAVYICVPPMAHGEIEEMLIQHRIPFFVEKPLSTDLETPKKILKQVKEAGLITSVGYHFRYSPETQLLKAKLERQTAGLITGKWTGDMPEVYWWRKQEGSGGQFIEQTTHIADLLRYLGGEAEEVYAVYGNMVNHKKYEDLTVADVGTVSLRMKSGAVVSLSNTCILPSGAAEVGISFYTNEGILNWEPGKLKQTGTNGTEQFQLDEEDPYEKESAAFLQAVKTGDVSGILSSYEDALETQKITVAATLSAAEGRPVKLSEMNE